MQVFAAFGGKLAGGGIVGQTGGGEQIADKGEEKEEEEARCQP